MISSSSRSNLARLIDSSDEDSDSGNDNKAAQPKRLPEPKSKIRYRDSLLSPNKTRSPDPKLHRHHQEPTYVTGSILQTALSARLEGTGGGKAGRLFSSLFPDDSEEDEDDQAAPIYEPTPPFNDRTNEVSRDTCSSDSGYIATTQRDTIMFEAAAKSPSVSSVRTKNGIDNSYNPDIRPNLSAPLSRADEPIALDGRDDVAGTCVPSAAAKFLKDYQVIGARWLWNKYVDKLGGILGDDM